MEYLKLYKNQTTYDSDSDKPMYGHIIDDVLLNHAVMPSVQYYKRTVDVYGNGFLIVTAAVNNEGKLLEFYSNNVFNGYVFYDNGACFCGNHWGSSIESITQAFGGTTNINGEYQSEYNFNFDGYTCTNGIITPSLPNY